MYSLANGFNEKDLEEFDERIKKFLNLKTNEKLEYICEPKINLQIQEMLQQAVLDSLIII